MRVLLPTVASLTAYEGVTPHRGVTHCPRELHSLPRGLTHCPWGLMLSSLAMTIPQVESLTAARNACRAGTEPSDAIRVVNAVLTQIDQIKR